MAIATYRSSGRLKPTTPLLFLGLAVAAITTAWLYQLLVRVIPFIYLNLLIVAGFGCLIGFGALWVIRAGHCRNALIGSLLAVAVGATAIAASHVWEYRHVLGKIQEKHPQLSDDEVRAELSFSQFVELKRSVGWKIKSSTMKGWGVTTVWVIEALIVVVCAGLFAFGAAAAPYCEACGAWCADKTLALHGATAADAQPHVDAENVSQLARLEPSGNDPAARLELELHYCEKCSETGFLTVREKRNVVDSKGKSEEKSTDLVVEAVLDPASRAAVLDRAGWAEGQKLAS